MNNFVLLHGKLWKRRQKQNKVQDLGLRQRMVQDISETLITMGTDLKSNYLKAGIGTETD